MAGFIQGNDGRQIFIGTANERLEMPYRNDMIGRQTGGGRMIMPMHGMPFNERGPQPVEIPQPYDTRASLDYGQNGKQMESNWGTPSKTPEPLPGKPKPLIEQQKHLPHIDNQRNLTERQNLQTPRRIELEGSCHVDLKKSTPNTYIIKQEVPGLGGVNIETYVHHNRGPGRTQ